MVTPAYEQTLPRLTTDYPAQVATYNEKYTNSPLKATQLGLDNTTS
jgi:hypothetical protein